MAWLIVIGCGVAMLAILYAALFFYRDLLRDEIDEVMEGREIPGPTRRASDVSPSADEQPQCGRDRSSSHCGPSLERFAGSSSD
jgi:hypothetical protein